MSTHSESVELAPVAAPNQYGENLRRMGHVELDKSWQAEERASKGSGRTTSTRPTLDFVCSNTNNVQELIAMEWDVFICHASEDKDSFVRPLAMGLQEAQLKVWYDEFTLNAGDSLRRSIDKGLAGSRWGLVVLSPYFFAKEWPQKELDGLFALHRLIVPIWYGITSEDVKAYSPMRVSGDVNGTALNHFGTHLTRCHCGRYSRTDRAVILTGARLFLNHVQGVNGDAIRITRTTAPEPALLTAFCAWMRAQRGTTDQTLYCYGIPLRELIRRFGENPSKLDAHRLRQFVLQQSRTTGWAVVKRCTTALRMFLRFLVAEGRCRPGLLGAIPVLAHWRLTSLPRYLAPEDLERLIASCDLSSPVGKRDRAILLLLARLGLRAGDIVQLRLQDIDWKGAWIHVSGKNRRETRLPLSQEVGQAIVAYLKEGRPQARTDALFIRSCAPFGALASHSAVSTLVDKAIRRAGIMRPSRGAAHLLRHSLATSMLRQGASLQDIAVLLRHSSIETTQIYAKVDIARLQEIAQPWPEVSSC